MAAQDVSEPISLVVRIWQEIEKTGWGDWSVKLVAAIIVMALSPWIARWFKQAATAVRRLTSSNQKLERARRAVANESRGLWLTEPVTRPARYVEGFHAIKPIIVAANLKGGVGKTTTTANLLAHYATTKKKRVLAIDLDFQGSLSSMCLAPNRFQSLMEDQSEDMLCKASRLISARDPTWLQNTADAVQDVPNASIVSSFYSLAATENRLMVQWLLDGSEMDVRYNLAAVLHSDRIQNAYDMILIDAPPRLTTACIQALCAATHVVIPTILDKMSASAVGTFADQLVNHEGLWPKLRIAGVVGTMVQHNPATASRPMNDLESLAYVACRDTLSAAVSRSRGPLREAVVLPEATLVPDKVELGRAAGNRISYATTTGAAGVEIRGIFDRLGDEIDKRISGGS